MKKIVLVALMALCGASLSYAKDPVAVCLEKCRGNADCAADCVNEKISGRSHEENMIWGEPHSERRPHHFD